MLQAAPNIELIAASDQGIEGAVHAVNPKKVVLVGYGGSEAGLKGVAAGTWYGTSLQLPATEGRVGVAVLIAAVQHRQVAAAVSTRWATSRRGHHHEVDCQRFHGEWPG